MTGLADRIAPPEHDEPEIALKEVHLPLRLLRRAAGRLEVRVADGAVHRGLRGNDGLVCDRNLVVKRVCKACARPLKEKAVIQSGKPATVLVCKSPICKRYGEAQ